jgi:taurine dioxygenase
MTETVIAERDPGAHLKASRVRMRGYDVMTGPTTYLAAERERLGALEFEHFDVARLGATIGAELRGVDLRRPLAPEVIGEIRAALFAFKVIFFRDQPITGEQHVVFARNFGELEVHPFIPSNTGIKELVRFEKSAEVAGYENAWHHDVTWRARPSMGAVLHAIKVPGVGGDTLFADMCAAYDGLDDDTKQRINGLTAIHDYMKAFGHQVPPDRQAEMRTRFPQAEHPVVCTHAETGRRHLYVNRNFVDHIVGLDPDENLRLMDLVSRQADYPEHQCRFHWEDHSIAFWDNRAVQHYAASDYWPQIRIMERASIVGPTPVA